MVSKWHDYDKANVERLLNLVVDGYYQHNGIRSCSNPDCKADVSSMELAPGGEGWVCMDCAFASEEKVISDIVGPVHDHADGSSEDKSEKFHAEEDLKRNIYRVELGSDGKTLMKHRDIGYVQSDAKKRNHILKKRVEYLPTTTKGVIEYRSLNAVQKIMGIVDKILIHLRLYIPSLVATIHTHVDKFIQLWMYMRRISTDIKLEKKKKQLKEEDPDNEEIKSVKVKRSGLFRSHIQVAVAAVAYHGSDMGLAIRPIDIYPALKDELGTRRMNTNWFNRYQKTLELPPIPKHRLVRGFIEKYSKNLGCLSMHEKRILDSFVHWMEFLYGTLDCYVVPIRKGLPYIRTLESHGNMCSRDKWLTSLFSMCSQTHNMVSTSNMTHYFRKCIPDKHDQYYRTYKIRQENRWPILLCAPSSIASFAVWAVTQLRATAPRSNAVIHKLSSDHDSSSTVAGYGKVVKKLSRRQKQRRASTRYNPYLLDSPTTATSPKHKKQQQQQQQPERYKKTQEDIWKISGVSRVSITNCKQAVAQVFHCLFSQIA